MLVDDDESAPLVEARKITIRLQDTNNDQLYFKIKDSIWMER